MQGIINVYKEQNYTSHDCVAILRRVTGIKKIGHTGTLDPMATGVLPVCIGKATKVIEFLEGDSKKYTCTMKLGVTTDTCDIWGNVLAENKPVTDKDLIEKTLMEFQGVQQQFPPMYSAIKVGGKKLYEYARAGKSVDVKPRNIEIYSINVLDINEDYVKFNIHCSKGTYIRSICDDAGKILGCGAAMADLERTACGKFLVEEAISIEKIKEMNDSCIADIIYPIDYPLEFERLDLNHEVANHLKCGRSAEIEGLEDNTYSVYYNDSFMGIACSESGILRVVKNINTETI